MTENNYLRNPELLSRSQSRLLIVDVQEKLIPAIAESQRVVNNCRKLIEAAGILGVPVEVTEQYPRGLGSTIPELRDVLEQGGVTSMHEKVRFSSAEVLNWGTAASREDERDQIVVAGIEAHVCVLQTALDLIGLGYRVSIPVDAVGSRAVLDEETARQRLMLSGATLTTTESVMFEWCEVAGTPEFKQISQLIKSS